MMPLANTLHRRLRDELEAIRCLSAQPRAAGGGCSEDGWHPKWSAWALLRQAWLAAWLAGWGWFDTSKNLNKVSGNAAKRKSSQAKPSRAIFHLTHSTGSAGATAPTPAPTPTPAPAPELHSTRCAPGAPKRNAAQDSTRSGYSSCSVEQVPVKWTDYST